MSEITQASNASRRGLDMGGEWTNVRLDDLILKRNQGVNTTTEKVSYSSAGIVVIRANNVSAGRIDFTDVTFVDSETFSRIKEPCKPKQGDVLYTNIGSQFGNAAIVEYIHPFVIAWNVLRLQPNENIDARFLTYLLNEPTNKSKVVGLNSSSTMPFVSGKEIGNVRFSTPPLPEQKRIAKILGDLDDKIELNRQMNATLEAMARALFQSWFVDFDPVIDTALAAGKDIPDEFAARAERRRGSVPSSFSLQSSSFHHLFPSEFVESELGLIPKGWRVGTVGEIAELEKSGINPGNYPQELFDHYSLPAFDDGRNPKRETGNEIMSNKFVVPKNSVLLTKLNPHIPRIWLPDLDESVHSVCSTEFMVWGSRESCSREFIYSLFTSDRFSSEYSTLVTGTTGSHQRIRPESVVGLKMIIPCDDVIINFTQSIKESFNKINRNMEESRSLVQMRDELLPILMKTSRGNLI